MKKRMQKPESSGAEPAGKRPKICCSICGRGKEEVNFSKTQLNANSILRKCEVSAPIGVDLASGRLVL